MPMALGEAFINVRADLKPFAKDLESDLKKILRAAEAKIKADSTLGRGVGIAFGKNAGDGLENGIEDGWERGTKKGVKKGVSESAKFFASLGDFLDDGLSAIPAEVKAAIVIGLTAAAVTIAPLLAGVISAAIIAGGTLGVAAIGILLASRFQRVASQFQGVMYSVLDRLAGPASRLIDPLVRVGEKLDQFVGRIEPNIDHIFDQIGGMIEPLTEAFDQFIYKIIVGLQTLIRSARPIIDALADSLPQLGEDIAIFLQTIASDSPDAALALRDFVKAVGATIIILGGFIRFLTETYFWLRVVAAAMTGDFTTASELFQQRALDSEHAAEGFASGLGNDLNPALSTTAAQAKATALAIKPLVTQLTKGFDASIDLAQAQADLAESIKNGNKDFRLSTQNGRDNLRLVKAEVDAIAQKRDNDLAYAIEHNQSTTQIEADYQRRLDAAEKQITSTHHETDAVKTLFDQYRNAPKEVSIAVETPGLKAAISNLKELARIFSKGALAGAANILAGQSHSHQAGGFAAGGIVTSPTLGLVGEAGYKEGIIPDPAVMPGRAMQLSNDLGLTQLISDSLGSRGTIVNVYIGSQRLQDMIDYTVAYNNQMTARAFNQGPRK